MKIIRQVGDIRLVKTIGNYFEERYEIQEITHSLIHGDLITLRAKTHNLAMALDLFNRCVSTQCEVVTRRNELRKSNIEFLLGAL